ncbi:MAG: hypothetical protein KDD84_13395 [Caldilineaceae bacterium]|nr:hypothetical protein [Caldilineaceae bacterium]
MCEQNDVGAQKFKTNLVGRPNWWMFCLLAVLAVGIGGCAELSTNPALRPTIVSSASTRTTPQLAVSPESVYAGSDIQVVGSNWPANSLVLVTLTDGENQSGILSATNADSDGDLATAFVYPSGENWLRAGAYTVVAYIGNGAIEATAQIVVDPAAGPTPTDTPIPTPTLAVTETPIPTVTPTDAPQVTSDWRGEYWANDSLSGSPALVRNDAAIVFSWGSSSPAPELPEDYFSARWRNDIYFEAGTYRFFVEVDDGARVLIDGVGILGEWREGPPRTAFVDYRLDAGVHNVQVEYFEKAQRAVIRFWWERLAP